MSAIVALFTFDTSSTGRAERMLSALKHRGEDKAGVWSDENIELGHRLQWTTEESLRESLPLKSRESGCVITCDARIDNRSDLIEQLSFNQISSREIADSEIILAAYDKWGEDCLPKLVGDFVFAIWDPNSKKLFCARDPLGVKHFYYYEEPGKIFALASEIKALFCIDAVRRELNEVSVGDYLVFNFADKESTFYKGIKRLPATHAMIVSKESHRIWQYWRPDSTKEVKLRNHGAYEEAFREKFAEAVTSRLRSSYPIGSMLSGGLDSSSITCVASEYLAAQDRQPIHTFSAIYPATSQQYPQIDEMQYMRSVIERSNCQPHFVNCDNNDPLKDMDRSMWHADHPMGMANIHVHLESFKKARAEGVRVLLDGTDGDSTVSHGYQAFTQLAKRGQLLSLVKEARLLKANMPQKGHSIENLVFASGMDQVIPRRLLKLWYTLTLRGKQAQINGARSQFDSVQWLTINKEFKKRYLLEDRVCYFNELNADKNINAIDSHWNALTSGHYARILEFAEIVSQTHSIEMRFPFFDRRLIEFCIGLPPEERIYNGWTRSIFRHAMAGILPEDVRWRTTKADLGAGLKLNLINHSFSQFDEIVNGKSTILETFVDIGWLRRVYLRFTRDPFKDDFDCLVLVSVVHLYNWLRQNRFME